MKILVKRMKAHNVRVFRIKDGNRDFENVENAEVLLFEEKKKIKTLGSERGFNLINRITLVTADPLEELPKDREVFAIEFDLKRNDGIYERLYIQNLRINKIDKEAWEFEIEPEVIDWSRFLIVN